MILLITKKIVTLAKYLDYVDIFLKKLVIKLYKYSKVNKYLIDLEFGK